MLIQVLLKLHLILELIHQHIKNNLIKQIYTFKKKDIVNLKGTWLISLGEILFLKMLKTFKYE